MSEASERAAEGLSRAELTEALREALSGLSLLLDGEAVGRLVAQAVDSELGRTRWEGRYDA